MFLLKRSTDLMNNSSRMSFLRQSMMDSALLWTLVLALSGLQLHATASPASTVQVRAGQDAVLQCPLLDASTTTSATTSTRASTLSWYRKAAGGGPQLLVTLGFMTGFVQKYGDGVGPEKISAAANGSLTLRNLDQNDSADYYCGISRGSENKPLTLTKK
ncbi:secreted immunoglobulin domain 1 [Mugil cephalus]|uniref:secreted immunoglobulin domain 1 n=1 Tax=Mugil cephalus TaxID=48193 RepID=UPI001FB83989|nr:secreted immunoglobulin domain 1 [Mugil cephalus]